LRRGKLPRQHAGSAQEEAEEKRKTKAQGNAERSAKDLRAQTQSAPQTVAVNAGGELIASGISIRDQFVSASEVRRLQKCADDRQSRGDFAAGRIGTRARAQRREDVRGDFTCWLREPFHEAESALLDRLEDLRLELNREAYLGLFELELHYALYPPGAGYARHVDQPQGTTQRKVSLVLYLNEQWNPRDGGVLRMHDANTQVLDIEPLGGRLVCFLTSGREHQVLPARRDRLSISGWFRARE
jgi:SM-20-related protein